ncbi:MAG: hypothetical protein KDB00_30105 [Planctomycetales bacterium]|nr:hypothetical protein [Planctomycetales bacterium]
MAQFPNPDHQNLHLNLTEMADDQLCDYHIVEHLNDAQIFQLRELIQSQRSGEKRSLDDVR